MKKLYLILAGALTLGTASLSAEGLSDAPATVQRVFAMYDLNTLSPKYGDNSYYNGFGLGYSADFRVSKSLPFYVGTGLDVRAVFNSEAVVFNGEMDRLLNSKISSQFVNINVPVNVSYRVPVADGFYLTPQLGLDLRVQLYGHAKYKMETPLLDNEDRLFVSESYNLFSKDDMGGEQLRRFQFGWHAAVNFEYQHFNLGLSFGTDFVKLHKNLGGSNFLVSLGYAF